MCSNKRLSVYVIVPYFSNVLVALKERKQCSTESREQSDAGEDLFSLVLRAASVSVKWLTTHCDERHDFLPLSFLFTY